MSPVLEALWFFLFRIVVAGLEKVAVEHQAFAPALPAPTVRLELDTGIAFASNAAANGTLLGSPLRWGRA